MAVKADLVIDQGTDFSATIDVTDSAGNAYDLTSFTPYAQLRKSYYSTNYYEFDTSDNGANGQITITMNNATTNSIEPGRYLYDVEIVSDSNVVERVVQGTVTVTPGITRIE